MADLQKQTLPLPELDIVEEMLRPLVAAKEIHERGNCFRIPIRASFSPIRRRLWQGNEKTQSPSARNRRLAHR